jgi:hypothetical protein
LTVVKRKVGKSRISMFQVSRHGVYGLAACPRLATIALRDFEAYFQGCPSARKRALPCEAPAGQKEGEETPHILPILECRSLTIVKVPLGSPLFFFNVGSSAP